MATTDRFPWGKVVERFEYDFDGSTMEVTKYYPWVYVNGRATKTWHASLEFHCDEIKRSSGSLLDLIIAWIAHKHLGPTEALYVGPALSRALRLQVNANTGELGA